MKKLVNLLLFAVICAPFASCLKGKGEGPAKTAALSAATLQGRWSIVRDSQYVTYTGIFTGRAPTSAAYAGKPDDYYNFTSYGVIYSHDGFTSNLTDTIYYKLNQDTLLFRYAYYEYPSHKIDSAYGPLYVISNFTGNTCVMTSSIWGPETYMTEVIHLSK